MPATIGKRGRLLRYARTGSLLIAAALAGCAAVTTADGERLGLGSEDFRAYVERVFREQNRVASDLAFAIEAAGSEEPAELAAAEDALLSACTGVNQLATSRRDEQDLGLRRSAAAARGVPDCERATVAARTALENAAL
jgi:hypothetical protein